MSGSSLPEYTHRRAAREKDFSRGARLDAQISYIRLSLVAAVVITVVLAVRGTLSPWVVLLPIAAYTLMAVWHDRVLREMARLARAVTFYEHGIARIEDRWHGTGEPGSRFLDEEHLYAADLDLFGHGSLFQLLSRARTQLGEATLAHWLTAPAKVATVRMRQAAVQELAGHLDFRETLATAGASRDVDTAALIAWASTPVALPSRWLRAVAIVLSTGIIAGIVWWVMGGPRAPLLIFVAVKIILTRSSRKTITRVVRGIEAPLRQLDMLSQMLLLIERQPLASPRLQELRATLASNDVMPSAAIKRLKRLSDMLDWRRNIFFAPISAALSWPLHIAAAIESWRTEFGPRVPLWLSAIAEYEALSSLAAYAFEHPADPFPVFVETPLAQFDGAGLGHPLLPAAKTISNDVRLSESVGLLIVSGSNMSGKSTLLRTVGINVVLAMAGAPVRARHLELTSLAVGTTLRIHDSLQEGRSRFYAEISRIRQIADLAGREPQPIFLLDELFQGTNSHDRRIGAEALLAYLVARGAIGLTTTHDLALTAIANRPEARAINVHFEDRIEGGELVFDYKMRPGPVTHSNALALMKAVGLPVPENEVLRTADDR